MGAVASIQEEVCWIDRRTCCMARLQMVLLHLIFDLVTIFDLGGYGGGGYGGGKWSSC